MKKNPKKEGFFLRLGRTIDDMGKTIKKKSKKAKKKVKKKTKKATKKITRKRKKNPCLPCMGAAVFNPRGPYGW